MKALTTLQVTGRDKYSEGNSMKKILTAVALILCSMVAASADPYSGHSSSWNNKQGTVSISSSAVTVIDMTGSNYGKVTIGDPLVSTLVYYRVDGTTTSVPTSGMWFDPSTPFTIESNQKIYFSLAASSATVTLRYLKSRR